MRISKYRSGSNVAPSRKHGAETATTLFRPQLDLQAKYHKKLNDLMDDTKEKKARAKVTLPKLKFQDSSS